MWGSCLRGELTGSREYRYARHRAIRPREGGSPAPMPAASDSARRRYQVVLLVLHPILQHPPDGTVMSVTPKGGVALDHSFLGGILDG
jgi:hypothetical protein